MAKPYGQHVTLAIFGEAVNVPQGVGPPEMGSMFHKHLGEAVNVPKEVGATRNRKNHQYALVSVQGDDGVQLSGWAAMTGVYNFYIV